MTTEGSETVAAWFAGRLPDDWFTAPADVRFDNEEILIVGDLAAPQLEQGATPAAVAEAESARIKRFREDTREHRMQVADEAQQRYRRKVSWGARCGSSTELFTVASVPVMTRLRISERQVLDTFIAAGIARSRSEALAWCVKLVGENEGDWITELRRAFEQVEQVRSKGPSSRRSS